MANLAQFYRDLLIWEDIAFCELVATWPTSLRDEIEDTFGHAVAASLVNGSDCPIHHRSSNQSIGNQIEKYTVSNLAPHISGFQLEPCRGAGYPDKLLVQHGSEIRIPVEIKATSDWNPSDSNRRVLTSSSEKLRRWFSPPINHLLLTIQYTNDEFGSARIDAIRLDFLEPSTRVNVRLEASVSHRILTSGLHHSRVI